MKTKVRNKISDSNLFALADQLNKLTIKYQLPYNSPGKVKHHTYTQQYDTLLDQYGLNRQDLIEELDKRLNQDNESEEETEEY